MIETTRLSIRPHTLETVPALHAILSDPLTMCFWPAPFSLRQTEEWVRRSIGLYETHRFGRSRSSLRYLWF